LKIIYSRSSKVGNKATSVTASSENPAYPATNLLLGQVSKVWRSVVAATPIATQTLTIALASCRASALGIFGINAKSIAYAVKDVAETTTYFSGTVDLRKTDVTQLNETIVYTSDFSAGIDSWSAYKGALDGNIDSIGGENDWLRYTIDNTNGQHMMYKSGVLVVGKRYRLSFKYYLPSTNSNLTGNLRVEGNTVYSDITVTLNVATTCTVNFVCDYAPLLFYFNLGSTFQDAGGNDVFYIKSVVVTELGPEPSWNRAWIEWTNNNLPIHIILTLTAHPESTYHECGEIVCGETIVIPDPQYGLSQSRENYQTVQQLAGGGKYVHPGVKPRSFELSWIMDRDLDFDDLDEAYETMGENPVAMLLSDNLDDDAKWCGYFHMTSAPKSSHNSPIYSQANLSIREAV
jgi:hypothetical protein